MDILRIYFSARRVCCFALAALLFGNGLIADEVSKDFLGPTKAGIDAGFCTPIEKNIDAIWGGSLLEKGARQEYKGDELLTIGMPCGGIGAGQLYVRGDGTLARWFIFGQHFNTHWGNLQDGTPKNYGYHTYRPESELIQGFAIQVEGQDEPGKVFDLSEKDFDDIRFIGEYPIAQIDYRVKNKTIPVRVGLEVFTPWIPLSPEESAYPATVMKFTLENTTGKMLNVKLAGWLENGVCLETRNADIQAEQINEISRAEGLTFLASSVRPIGQDADKISSARDFGTMGLALFGEDADIKCTSASPESLPESAFDGMSKAIATKPIKEKLVGVLGRTLTIKPQETKEVVFVVSWHFPNYANPDDRGDTGAVGRMYSNWFNNAFEVAEKISDNFEHLDTQTHLFRDTYYDTTLPYWFVRRIGMPVSILATLTSQWWENGRFYNYEGVGFCAGSCTHVYAYSQAMARLFPSLERTIRARQELCQPAQDPNTGRVNFRGQDYQLGEGLRASGYAADGQCAVVLRVYREHLMTADNSFLDSVWPATKKAMEFMISKDAEDGQTDGVIRCRQHSTWDTDFYGANTYTGALYLAALKASERMATIENDLAAAEKYHKIQVSGTKHSIDELWNGDYFIQTFPKDIPVKPSKAWGEVAVQYQNGCFSNQLFGQNFASQLGLGYLYPQNMVRKTLSSVYRYNWVPDMEILYQNGKPYKYVLANDGEAGLLQGTWPLDKRPINDVKLMEHIWTGFEYQVASHMIYEGQLEEAFAIVRGIDDRYDGAKHNPWNEIEGGDHYGRAMASWGCLLNVTGFDYDGPNNHLGFAPRFKPEDFKAFYSSAESWGSLSQKCDQDIQLDRIDVKWGVLKLRTLAIEIPDGKEILSLQMTNDGDDVDFSFVLHGRKLVLSFPEVIEIEQAQKAVIKIKLN